MWVFCSTTHDLANEAQQSTTTRGRRRPSRARRSQTSTRTSSSPKVSPPPFLRHGLTGSGYEKVLKTHRKHMARMGERHLDKDEEIKLDGIGGVSILVKADGHRSGISLPPIGILLS